MTSSATSAAPLRMKRFWMWKTSMASGLKALQIVKRERAGLSRAWKPSQHDHNNLALEDCRRTGRRRPVVACAAHRDSNLAPLRRFADANSRGSRPRGDVAAMLSSFMGARGQPTRSTCLSARRMESSQFLTNGPCVHRVILSRLPNSAWVSIASEVANEALVGFLSTLSYMMVLASRPCGGDDGKLKRCHMCRHRVANL